MALVEAPGALGMLTRGVMGTQEVGWIHELSLLPASLGRRTGTAPQPQCHCFHPGCLALLSPRAAGTGLGRGREEKYQNKETQSDNW